jgi:hypothetical protein
MRNRLKILRKKNIKRKLSWKRRSQKRKMMSTRTMKILRKRKNVCLSTLKSLTRAGSSRRLPEQSII